MYITPDITVHVHVYGLEVLHEIHVHLFCCSCEVIRDSKTKESLQYAFIEFEKVSHCFLQLLKSISHLCNFDTLVNVRYIYMAVYISISLFIVIYNVM